MDDTYSLTASVLDYEYENGRRYHAYHAGEYPMPNDEAEQERLDMMHHIFLLSYNGNLYRAPLGQSVGRALDVGCGTGIWAMDFADTHPEAQVIATDLSAIQPSFVPENLQFEIDDAENPWQFNHRFDYIHLRGMAGSIGDWPQLLQQAYDNLNPGGWVEILDFEAWASTDDGSLPEDSAYNQYQVLLSQASETFGKRMNISPRFHEFVQNAGFINTVEDARKVPLSPWPTERRQRKLGRYMQITMSESLEAYGLALFTRLLNWDNNMIQAHFAGVRQDLKNMDYHIYSVAHCVYGQKPFTEPQPEPQPEPSATSQ